MTEETVTITDNGTGKQVTLPLHTDRWSKTIDIGALYKELGYFAWSRVHVTRLPKYHYLRMVTTASRSTRVTRSNSLPKTALISKSATC